MTDRHYQILNEMQSGDWVRPMDVGGTDSSHHSSTLKAMITKGWVRKRGGICWCRPSYKYQITGAGILVLGAEWRKRMRAK